MTNLSVTLTPELRLEQALKEADIENPASVANLAIAGTMTEDDFEYICEKMAKTLQTLDMSEASVENNKIPDFAFYECSGLTSIIIPDLIIEIKGNAFSGCFSLTEITAHPDNPVYASENGVLLNKDKTELLLCPPGRQDYVIPYSVVKIGRGAFNGCSYLASVTIPETVIEIGEGAFYGCMSLYSVVIPQSVNEIGDYAFGSCYNLTSVTIPQTVVKIGNNVFSGCISLSQSKNI
jgi:hypothetical protein